MDKHQMKTRMRAGKYFDIMMDEEKPVAFLDEKWFYTTSRRKKIKVLPKGSCEVADPLYVSAKMRSRRYPIKIMYLGVVGTPNKKKQFDGRMFLKRASTTKKAKRRVSAAAGTPCRSLLRNTFHSPGCV